MLCHAPIRKCVAISDRICSDYTAWTYSQHFVSDLAQISWQAFIPSYALGLDSVLPLGEVLGLVLGLECHLGSLLLCQPPPDGASLLLPAKQDINIRE